MIRKILTYPKDKEILTKKSVEVEDIHDKKVQNIIKDLIDTLKSTNGVGISAIQIGEPYRICVINWDGLHVLINPTIERSRGTHELKEGCLSVPGLYIKHSRPQKLWIKAFNEKGEQIEYAEGGNGSYIAAHELEHFDGKCILFDTYDELLKNNKRDDYKKEERETV